MGKPTKVGPRLVSPTKDTDGPAGHGHEAVCMYVCIYVGIFRKTQLPHVSFLSDIMDDYDDDS